jgi:hypothetical protein
MKRRRFQSIALIPKCGYVAICEEGRGWVFTFDDPKWRMLLELPPIEEPANAGLLTREQYAKEHDRLYGTDMAKLPAGFFDPSLGQPWPEDQAPDHPIAWCRSDDYQQSSEKLQSFSGWTEPHCGLDMPLYAAPQIAYQGLGRQDLPIRDWAKIAGKVDRAERLLVKSIDETDIDTGCVLRSLIEDIRNELGLPRPGEVAQ